MWNDHPPGSWTIGQLVPRDDQAIEFTREFRVRSVSSLRLGLPRPVHSHSIQQLSSEVYQVRSRIVLRVDSLRFTDHLDVHSATVSSLRTNSSFILIACPTSPMCNRTVPTSMHGVGTYACTIRRKAKTCAMPGKTSKPCSMVATGNDRLRARTPITRAANCPPSRTITNKRRTTRKRSTTRKVLPRETTKKKKEKKRTMANASFLFHRLRNCSRAEQRRGDPRPIMLFLRRQPMNNYLIWICFSRCLLNLHHFLLLCTRQRPVTIFPFHLPYLLPVRSRSSRWIPTIGYNSFAHRCSCRAFFARHFLACPDDSRATSTIRARRSLAVVPNRHSNHPYKNMTRHLSALLHVVIGFF